MTVDKYTAYVVASGLSVSIDLLSFGSRKLIMSLETNTTDNLRVDCERQAITGSSKPYTFVKIGIAKLYAG
jgi:hypothetical protein